LRKFVWIFQSRQLRNQLKEEPNAKLQYDEEALRVTEMTCEHQVHEKLNLENKSGE
jgi:hypothetical protein